MCLRDLHLHIEKNEIDYDELRQAFRLSSEKFEAMNFSLLRFIVLKLVL